jgi:hypothetical protein
MIREGSILDQVTSQSTAKKYAYNTTHFSYFPVLVMSGEYCSRVVFEGQSHWRIQIVHALIRPSEWTARTPLGSTNPFCTSYMFQYFSPYTQTHETACSRNLD